MNQTKIMKYFFRTTQAASHFDYVDALRGLAILSVIYGTYKSVRNKAKQYCW